MLALVEEAGQDAVNGIANVEQSAGDAGALKWKWSHFRGCEALVPPDIRRIVA